MIKVFNTFTLTIGIENQNRVGIFFQLSKMYHSFIKTIYVKKIAIRKLYPCVLAEFIFAFLCTIFFYETYPIEE